MRREETLALLERRLESAATSEERERLYTIAENLERGWMAKGPFEPRGSSQGWEEVMYYTLADTQILNTTTETIMVPNYSIPANYLYPGRILKYTLFFDWSTVITTPGTLTLALRWGGVAGTALATSGAFAPDPTAASTTVSGMVEYILTCRSQGTAGSVFTMGRMTLSDFDDASVTTIVGNLNMLMIPPSAPAAVTVDTTTAANALSPTAKFSVATATTQLTTHMAILETLT